MEPVVVDVLNDFSSASGNAKTTPCDLIFARPVTFNVDFNPIKTNTSPTGRLKSPTIATLPVTVNEPVYGPGITLYPFEQFAFGYSIGATFVQAWHDGTFDEHFDTQFALHPQHPDKQIVVI